MDALGIPWGKTAKFISAPLFFFFEKYAFFVLGKLVTRVNGSTRFPIYFLAKPQRRERAWDNQRGKKTLLSLN